MARSLSLVLVLAGVLASMGAGYSVQTTNFVVEAPTYQIAQEVAKYAEYYRKDKAMQWLGREMPPWPTPCPVKVVVTTQAPGGATNFYFGNGQVTGQDMEIKGPLDRLLSSVLPHEITHTVFAYHFRCPLPRWADEGGAVLSEDDVERNRHDQLVRTILNSGQAMSLRHLFGLREYPQPNFIFALYAQGFSVTNFLVAKGGKEGRPTFLNFVAYGMRNGWDPAVQTYYHFRNIEDLQKAWIDSLRTPRQAPMQLAHGSGPAEMDTASRVVERQTVPSLVSLSDRPRPLYQTPGEGNRTVWGPRRSVDSHE